MHIKNSLEKFFFLNLKKKKTEVYAISLILKISIMLLYRYVALDYMQLFLSKTNPTSSLTKKL